MEDTRAISVRLDDEARRALETLMRGGRTRSAAIRHALVEAAGRQEAKELAAEAAALATDREDVAEMSEVAALMESLRAAG